MIRFDAVGRAGTRGRPAVADVSFELARGSRTALFGPTGAGKSVLLGMLNRLHEPSSGTITWDDKPLKSHRKASLRRAIGWWSQPSGLFTHQSVFDNIAAVPQRLGWADHVQRARVFELLEALDLPRPLAVRQPTDLTPVQQVAVAAGPEVVVADDPLATLVGPERHALATLVSKLQPDWADRWLLGTRTLTDAVALADNLVVLDGGRVLQVGALAEVIDHPADERVAELVGPDRGLRSLTLLSAATVRPRRVATVRDPAAARPGVATLVIDRQAQPVAWTRGVADPDGVVPVAGLGTSFVPSRDTLRDALEAVLTSPAGLGVAIGDNGRYLGVIGAEDVWQQVGQHRESVAEQRAAAAHAERVAAHAELVAAQDDAAAAEVAPETAPDPDAEAAEQERPDPEPSDPQPAAPEPRGAESGEPEPDEVRTAAKSTDPEPDPESDEVPTAAGPTDPEPRGPESSEVRTAAEPADPEADPDPTEPDPTEPEHAEPDPAEADAAAPGDPGTADPGERG